MFAALTAEAATAGLLSEHSTQGLKPARLAGFVRRSNRRMKYSYAIHPQRRMIFLTYEGHFTVAQLIECTELLWADRDYDPTFNGIADITSIEPTADLGSLCAFISFMKAEKRTSSGRWAVITSSPLATAGALLYKRALAPRHMFEVFSTWECAGTFLQWEAPRPELKLCPLNTPPIASQVV